MEAKAGRDVRLKASRQICIESGGKWIRLCKKLFKRLSNEIQQIKVHHRERGLGHWESKRNLISNSFVLKNRKDQSVQDTHTHTQSVSQSDRAG